MFTLIMLGTLAALFFSAFALLLPQAIPRRFWNTVAAPVF
jgi:hypothetical protein